MSEVVTDRSIQRKLVMRPECDNGITFGFSSSIAAFTWSLLVRQYGTEANLLSLTEGNGLTKTATQLVAEFDLSNFGAGEFVWLLFYAGSQSYFLINGPLKTITEIYSGDANASEQVTVNLNSTDVTLTITPWLT